MTPAQQRALQKVFILVTGTAANAEQLQWLDAVTAWSSRGQAGLAPVIDGFFGALEPQVGAGALVRTLVGNGLGVTLDDAAAAALAQALPSMGVGSWSALVTLLMSAEAGVGRVLAQRSDAAMGFLDALSASGKSAFFQGAAVSRAVTTHLQRIGSSDAVHQAAVASLADLAANLTASGIRVGVGGAQLSGATVFVPPRIWLDDMPWQGRADARGVAEIPGGLTASTLMAIGGTDLFTGRAFKGVLSAPMGATVITPLTTLAQALLAKTPGMTVAQAADRVLAALDLPASLDLLSFDPFDRLTDPDEGALALRAQAGALQVSSVIAVLSQALTAVTNIYAAAVLVLDALAAALAGSAGPLPLTHIDTLRGVVNAALTNAGSGLAATTAAQLAQVLAAGNAAIAASATPTELSRAAVVTQSQLVDAVVQALQAGSLDGVVSAYTGASLRQAIATAVPGQLTIPSGSSGLSLTGTGAPDSLRGGLGNDTIQGLVGSDTLEGEAGDDRIEGGDGDDLLMGNDGNDILDGGAGDDRLIDDEGSNLLDGGAGADRLSAESRWDRHTLLGGAGNDWLFATGLAVWLDGGDDADVLIARGTLGPNNRPTYVAGMQATLLGGTGADWLEARDLSRAVLIGGDGDDSLRVNSVDAATLTAGAGSDTIELTRWQYYLAVDPGFERAETLVVTDFAAGAQGDVLDWAGLAPDTVVGVGHDGGNVFARGYLTLRQVGADTVLSFDRFGLAGSAKTPVPIAVLRGVTATSLVATNFSPAVAPDGSVEERIEGGAGNDILWGVSYADRQTLVGASGDDELRATGGAVVLDGGDGDDYLVASGAGRETVLPAYVAGAQATLLGGAGTDRLAAVSLHQASLDGGAGDDTLYASDLRAATLLGGEGSDRLYMDLGSMNTPSVEGEAAILPAWLLDGGSGNDSMEVQGSGPAWGGASLTLLGGLGDDTLLLADSGSGFAGALVQGGEGADRLIVSGVQSATLSGGAGSDTIVLASWQLQAQLQSAPTTLPRAQPLRVTDFAAGAAGDVLDCVDLLNIALGYDGRNPFASGHLRLRQYGPDTQLSFDVDGSAGSAYGPIVLAVLLDVAVSRMTAANVALGVELGANWVFG